MLILSRRGRSEFSGTSQVSEIFQAESSYLVRGRGPSVNTLFAFLPYEMFFVLATLAVMVGYRLLTGQINTKNLLRDKVTNKFSPGRLQMLIATGFVAVYFVAQVLETEKMPQLPQEFILALGGIHLLYLGGKIYSVLANKLTKIVGRINQ